MADSHTMLATDPELSWPALLPLYHADGNPQSARGELTIPFKKASSQKESEGYIPSKGDSTPCGGQNVGFFSSL